MSDTRQEFLTVEQTAAVCGIGRTSAYQLARRAADHGDGDFPAVRFGKQLRIPRRKLEDLIGGPIILPTDPPPPPAAARPPRRPPPPTTTTPEPPHRTAPPPRPPPTLTNHNSHSPHHDHQPNQPTPSTHQGQTSAQSRSGTDRESGMTVRVSHPEGARSRPLLRRPAPEVLPRRQRAARSMARERRPRTRPRRRARRRGLPRDHGRARPEPARPPPRPEVRR